MFTRRHNPTSLPFLGLMSGGWFRIDDSGDAPLGDFFLEADPGYLDGGNFSEGDYMAKHRSKQAPTPSPAKPVASTSSASAEVSDVLQTALAARVAEESKPVREGVARVRACLDAYSVSYDEDVKRRTIGVLLKALGEVAPEPNPMLQNAVDALLEATDALRALLKPTVESVVDVAPVVEQDPTSPPVQVLERSPIPPIPADPKDVLAARRLLDEIHETEYEKEHPVRLAHLLQALVAETRLCIEQLPSNHALAWQLSRSIAFLGRIRHTNNVDCFIRGLAREHRDNWAKVASDARARIAKFDADTEIPVSVPKQPAQSSKKDNGGNGCGAKTSYTWPELKNLRKKLLNEALAIAIVGGWARPEKLEVLQERFGLEPEWHETDSESPRMTDEAVGRINGGRIAAVVILNGLITHKDFKRIQDACETQDVPWVVGERGGVASFETAFTALDQKMGMS